jgi:hypothetical protein
MDVLGVSVTVGVCYLVLEHALPLTAHAATLLDTALQL